MPPIHGAVSRCTSRDTLQRHADAVAPLQALAALGGVLARAQAHHLGIHDVSAEDQRLIRWETARRWGRVGRASLRAGTVTLADLVSVRPAHLGLGYAGLDTLALGGAIGGLRRARQTFAA